MSAFIPRLGMEFYTIFSPEESQFIEPELACKL